MKIYTKTGDGGVTSLIGGRRVAKNHPRVEAYGTVDELMAHIAYLKDNINQIELNEYRLDLTQILNDLMVVSAVLACDDPQAAPIPVIDGENIGYLERRVDYIQAELPPVERFTLPGGHPLVSLAHIARTVCRRAERDALTIGCESDGYEDALRYLNRLSDYLYVLGRKFSQEFNVEEVLWEPNK